MTLDLYMCSGVDKDDAFTHRAAARRSGLLREKITVIDEKCSQLALNTNGSVFNGNVLYEVNSLRSNSFKDFVTF